MKVLLALHEAEDIMKHLIRAKKKFEFQELKLHELNNNKPEKSHGGSRILRQG
jgi:hypothetical protein